MDDGPWTLLPNKYPEKLLEMKNTLKKEVAALLQDSHIWE